MPARPGAGAGAAADSDDYCLSRAAVRRYRGIMSSPPTSYCCDRRPADQVVPGDAPVIPENGPPPVKTRILFVDDEPSMLRVLKMGMRSMAASWDMELDRKRTSLNS